MVVRITYFVHSTTTDNENKLATGWNQGELSEKGINQSKELKKLIKDEFDEVFCSDLKRAIDSAKYNFDNREIKIDKRIRECNYGEFNGKASANVIYDEHIYDRFPQGESLIDVEKRVREFARFLLDNYNGKHIAIVSHRAPQLAFEVITKGKTWEEAINEDWRKKKEWKPGWNYEIKGEEV